MDRGAWWAPVHGVTKIGHDRATHTYTQTHKGDTIEIVKGVDTEFRLEKVRLSKKP